MLNQPSWKRVFGCDIKSRKKDDKNFYIIVCQDKKKDK